MFKNLPPTFLLLLIFFYSCENQTNKPEKQSIVTAKQETSSTEKTSQQPNIVLIVADDLGWNDVGYHKSDIKTPRIDEIVKKSVDFDRFYAYHSCTPTRVGVLTGKFPSRFGLTHVLFPKVKGGLPNNEETIAEYLADYGYKDRACIGKWHLGHSSKNFHPLNQGFTYFYGCYGGLVDYFTHKNSGELDWHRNSEANYDKGYSTDLITNEAIKFIAKSNTIDPFFLYVPYTAPHSPLQAPKQYLDMYGFDENKPIFSDPAVFPTDTLLYYQVGQGNTERQTYAAMVTAMDAGIGKIYDALKKKGILENTFFLFLSDNGGDVSHGADNFPFTGVKGSSNEGGVRVPAFLHYPNLVPKSKKIDAVVSYVDIMPTIKDIVGGNTDNKVDGISFKDVVKTKNDQQHKDRFLYISSQSVVHNDLKIVNDNLYNLKNDKKEKKDLSKQQESIFRMLKDSLKKFNKTMFRKKKMDRTHQVTPEWEMM